jgi:hypothetical protein
MGSLINKISKKTNNFNKLVDNFKRSLKERNSEKTAEEIFEEQKPIMKEARRIRRNKKKALKNK